MQLILTKPIKIPTLHINLKLSTDNIPQKLPILAPEPNIVIQHTNIWLMF